MCGIGGGFGPNIDPMAIRSLALLNESRGRDSFGVFDAKHRFFKEPESVKKVITTKECSKFIRAACQTDFVVCHTRATTRGNVNKNNAHPFEYGPILGCHNGVLDAPNEYAVDSMYAMDQLSKFQPEQYQEALKDVAGWYVLVWGDKRDGKLYLLNWTGSLAFAKGPNGAWYFSSDGDHLEQALGVKLFLRTSSGQAFCYDPKQPERGLLQFNNEFKGGTRKYPVRDYTSNHYYQNADNPMKYTGDVWRFEKDGYWFARRSFSIPEHWAYVPCQDALNSHPRLRNADKGDVGWNFLVDEIKKEHAKIVEAAREARANEDTKELTVVPEPDQANLERCSEALAQLATSRKVITNNLVPEMIQKLVDAGKFTKDDITKIRAVRSAQLKENGHQDDQAIDKILYEEGWFTPAKA